MATTPWLCATSAAAVHDGAATAITIAEIRHRWRARRSLLIALISLLRAAPNTCATKDMLADLSRHQGSRRQGRHYHRSRPPDLCSRRPLAGRRRRYLQSATRLDLAPGRRRPRAKRSCHSIERVGTATVAVVLEDGAIDLREEEEERWAARSEARRRVGGGAPQGQEARLQGEERAPAARRAALALHVHLHDRTKTVMLRSGTVLILENCSDICPIS